MWAGIAHTAYTVPDMDAALDFYVGKLGLSHAFTLRNDDGVPTIEYLMLAPGQFIELFYARAGFENPKGSYAHLCLRTEALEDAVTRLSAAGVAIRRGVQRGRDGNLQAWIDDPAGNAIELMQIADDSPQARVSRGESAGI